MKKSDYIKERLQDEDIQEQLKALSKDETEQKILLESVVEKCLSQISGAGQKPGKNAKKILAIPKVLISRLNNIVQNELKFKITQHNESLKAQQNKPKVGKLKANLRQT